MAALDVSAGERVAPLLSVRALSVRRGGEAVVDRISFTAGHGEIVVLKGASGSGKTTILRAIAGLDAIAEGAIVIDGVAAPAGPRTAGAGRPLRRTVGMVFQFHHLFAHLTALHNVWLAPVHVLKEPRAEAERRAMALLERLGVGHRRSAWPHQLSGGEAQRVAIARAMAMDPRVLLLDEPTASLDGDRRKELAITLRQLAEGGCTLVIASHDDEFVAACAQRIVEIEAGRLVGAGELPDSDRHQDRA